MGRVPGRIHLFRASLWGPILAFSIGYVGCSPSEGRLEVWGDDAAVGAHVLVSGRIIGELRPCPKDVQPINKADSSIGSQRPRRIEEQLHYSCCLITKGVMGRVNVEVVSAKFGTLKTTVSTLASGGAVYLSFGRHVIVPYDGSP